MRMIYNYLTSRIILYIIYIIFIDTTQKKTPNLIHNIYVNTYEHRPTQRDCVTVKHFKRELRTEKDGRRQKEKNYSRICQSS